MESLCECQVNRGNVYFFGFGCFAIRLIQPSGCNAFGGVKGAVFYNSLFMPKFIMNILQIYGTCKKLFSSFFSSIFLVYVLLSAHVQRFSVCYKQNTYLNVSVYPEFIKKWGCY